MFLDNKPFIYLWRPFYQRIYTPLLARFTLRSPNIHFATLDADQKLQWLCLAVQELQQETAKLAQSLAALDRETKAQWAAMEQVILSILGDSNKGVLSTYAVLPTSAPAYNRDHLPPNE